jgi:hypothetical protein
MLTLLGWAVVLATVLALGAVGSAALAVRRARQGIAEARALAGRQTLRALEHRLHEIEVLVVDRPMLMGLYDRNCDLMSGERMATVKLAAFARLHLELFATVAELRGLRAGGAARADPIVDAALGVWEHRMHHTFAGSRLLRQMYAADRDRYPAPLGGWFDAAFPNDGRDPLPDDAAPSAGDGR